MSEVNAELKEEEFNVVFEKGTVETFLSDSEDEIEEFNPNPYAFILKDAYRNVIMLPPDKVSNAIIACPSFHILLDHVVAVLWCLYSPGGTRKMGTAQVHWAIKFLEGLTSRYGVHTPDVAMAINHLEEALVEIGSTLDEKAFCERKYDEDYTDLTASFRALLGHDQSSVVDGYEEFEENLIGRSPIPQGTIIDSDEEGNEDITLKFKSEKDLNTSRNRRDNLVSPSFILNNMLDDHGHILQEIMIATMSSICDRDEEQVFNNRPVADQDSVQSITDKFFLFRNDLIARTIDQLEQIKDVDTTIQALQCKMNPQTLAAMKNMMDKSG